MNIHAITAIAPTQIAGIGALPEASSLHQAPGTAGVGFNKIVSDGLESINKGLISAETDLQQLATGDVQNLHQIMIRLEESRLSFQLMLQVRNRLLEAYQDIMKMQV